MFSPDEFSKHCVSILEATNAGFSTPHGEHLLLRDPENALVTWAVTRKNSQQHSSVLPSPISEYKRTCHLYFSHMVLPTQLPAKIDELLCQDAWPPVSTSTNVTQLKRKGQKDESVTKKARQEYRLHVNEAMHQAFNSTNRATVEMYVPNTDKYAVLAWGLTETLLEETHNPFKYLPLLLYNQTLAEWLYNVVRGHSVSQMAYAMLNHENAISGKVLYRNNEKGYIIAKRDDVAPPLVHLSDDNSERPINDRPEAFMTALFFYLYAGGKMGTLKVTKACHLEVCVSAAVKESLMQEPDLAQTLKKYKRVLVDITHGRTNSAMVEQFQTVSDLAENLSVDEAELKFDIPTLYTHPDTGKAIKLAVSKTNGKVLCRWTDIVPNPPDRNFLGNATLRKALVLHGNYVEMSAVDALSMEMERSVHEAVLTFTDTDSSLLMDAMSPNFVSSLLKDNKLDLRATKAFAEQLQKEIAYAAHVRVGTTTSGEHAIVYGESGFAVVAANLSNEETEQLRRLNSIAHLRVVMQASAPMVSDLYEVDLTQFDYLNLACGGDLSPLLPQIQFLQSTEDTVLQKILQQAFVNGPWKQQRALKTLAATLDEALKRVAGARREPCDLKCDDGKEHVPLYVARGMGQGDVCHVVHYSKTSRYIVYAMEAKGNRMERSLSYTRMLNRSDAGALLGSHLGSDVGLAVYFVHVAYNNKAKATEEYKRLLSVFKAKLFELARVLYNVEVTHATALGVFDPVSGEKMLTEMIEAEFFSRTSSNVSLLPLNVVDKLKGFREANVDAIVLQEESVLFVKKEDNITRPVLYVYGGDGATRVLHETLYNMWLGSSRGHVGFLILPSERSYESEMEASDSKVTVHSLTLVATTDCLQPPIAQDHVIYGTVVDGNDISDTDPSLQRLLSSWLQKPTLSDMNVAEVVAQHARNVLTFGCGGADPRPLNPSFTNATTLTNGLQDMIIPDVWDRLVIGRNGKYGSLMVSTEEFRLLFSRKNVHR